MEHEQLLALDEAIVKESVRKRDKNGYLHVGVSNLTCDQVAPYYGREIPHWKDQKLDPERIYYGWRNAEELEKALPTFNGVPLLIKHKFDSAKKPNTELRVGTVGTSAKWEAPFITNALSVWNEDAIKAIEDGSLRDLSCGYTYEPDFTAGTTPDGIAYDFVMRNIACNHVALVQNGRATDCFVGDSLPEGMKNMDKPIQGGCDDFTEFARKVIESANTGLDPEKIDALVRAFAEAHAQFEQSKADQAKQDVDGTVSDTDTTEPAKTDEPKQAEPAAQDSDTTEPDDKKDDAQGAQDADTIVKTIKGQLKAQYQAAADVKDIIGNVDAMAYDSADDIYIEAIKKMGYDGKVDRKAAKSVFLALRSVKKEATPKGALDSNPKDKSFLTKFLKK